MKNKIGREEGEAMVVATFMAMAKALGAIQFRLASALADYAEYAGWIELDIDCATTIAAENVKEGIINEVEEDDSDAPELYPSRAVILHRLEAAYGAMGTIRGLLICLSQAESAGEEAQRLAKEAAKQI